MTNSKQNLLRIHVCAVTGDQSRVVKSQKKRKLPKVPSLARAQVWNFLDRRTS